MTNHKHDRDATVDRLLARTAQRAEESSGACLDAETLAAWADAALDAGEIAAAEAHAADCARCQAVLATMAKTAPTMPVATAHPWRMPSLQWLVPLTAAAAAGIIWVVVPMREGPTNVREVSQVAESVPQSGPAPARPDTAASSPERTAGSNARREQAAPQADKGVEADQKVAASPAADAILGAPARSADARLENAQQAAQPPVATPASPPAAAAAARVFSFGAAETVVVSSNPASRWRILPGGAVQRSADAGSTWLTQNTGVTETLSAGASPLPSVCWLVGPGGIVLLSTDGLSWKRLAFPEAVPLVAVRATDAQNATVTTADGREFVTEDAGGTWVRAPGR